PVARQDDRDVRIVRHPVELVQELEQEGSALAAHRALTGDEVDVLEHEQARSQLSREPADGPDRTERPAGENDHGRLRELRRDPAHRVRLAGARRSVEQQAALEVPARREQRTRTLVDEQRVTLDVAKDALRQDY